MPTIDEAISISLPNKMADAVVACLLQNVPLAARVEGRIYRHNPESLDSFQIGETIIVWPEPNLTSLNPQPGDFAHPVIVLAMMYIAPTRNSPYGEDEVGPTDILIHMEKILERGTVNPLTGLQYELGKLVNPDHDPLDPLVPDDQKFLNRQRPEFQQRTKRVIPQTNTTAWPDLVTYKSTTTRQERRLQ